MKIDVKSVVLLFTFLFVGFFLGRYWGATNMYDHHAEISDHDHMEDMGDRETFIGMKSSMISQMIGEGDYKCCLEKPCTYCIEKTPGHGEGATCSCLEDVMNGVHPCGECIGEILEGHGNRFISKYFATAIAEEVGPQYLDTFKRIIADKYDVSFEEQI